MPSHGQKWDSLMVVKWTHFLSIITGLSTAKLVYTKVYASLLAAILLCSSVHSVYHRTLTIHRTMIPSIRIFDIIFHCSIATASIISVMFESFSRRSLENCVNRVEDKFLKKLQTRYEYSAYYLFVYFVFFEGLVLGYVFYDCAFTFSTFSTPYTYISHVVNIYIISTVVVKVTVHLWFLKRLLSLFNKRLLGNMLLPGENNANPLFFLKAYVDIWDIIEKINEIYGHQLTSILLAIVLALLNNLNVMLKVAMGIQIVPEFVVMGAVPPPPLLNTMLFLLFGMILAVHCEKVLEELRSTSTIGHKILLSYTLDPKLLVWRENKEQLTLLSEYISTRRIEFSASGLFPLDYSILFLITGTVVSNVVVILQFN